MIQKIKSLISNNKNTIINLVNSCILYILISFCFAYCDNDLLLFITFMYLSIHTHLTEYLEKKI